MGQIKSWEVSEELWEKVEELIPKRSREEGREYKRSEGGGRKRMGGKQIFAGIVYVLRTGIQWKALPKEYGSASAIHKHFQEWQRAGFFEKLWIKGLAEYEEMKGIGWKWQSIDGATNKAPLAQECVGSNPTDRGKKWAQKKFASRRAWNPIIVMRKRSQHS